MQCDVTIGLGEHFYSTTGIGGVDLVGIVPNNTCHGSMLITLHLVYVARLVFPKNENVPLLIAMLIAQPCMLCGVPFLGSPTVTEGFGAPRKSQAQGFGSGFVYVSFNNPQYSSHARIFSVMGACLIELESVNVLESTAVLRGGSWWCEV